MSAATVAQTSAPLTAAVRSHLVLDLYDAAAELERRAVLAPNPATERQVAELRTLAADILKADREAAEAREWVRGGPVAPMSRPKPMGEFSDEELVQLRAALRGGRA